MCLAAQVRRIAKGLSQWYFGDDNNGVFRGVLRGKNHAATSGQVTRNGSLRFAGTFDLRYLIPNTLPDSLIEKADKATLERVIVSLNDDTDMTIPEIAEWVGKVEEALLYAKI